MQCRLILNPFVRAAWYEQALQTMDKEGIGRLQAWGQFEGHQTSVVMSASQACMDCRYEPAMQATDERVVSGLDAAGVAAVGHQGHLLYEPQGVRVDMGRWKGHYGTLMPFLMCVLSPSLPMHATCIEQSPSMCWALPVLFPPHVRT